MFKCRESAPKQKVTEALAEQSKGGENRQALQDDILAIVLDPPIGDEQVGILLRTTIGMDRMRAAQADRREPLSRDHGHMPTGRPSSVAGPQVRWATSDIATVAVGS